MRYDWIKRRRERRGLTQADVAGALGKSQTYVSKVEAGQIDISVATLKQFADVLGFDLAEAVRGLTSAEAEEAA
ncbi:MAG: transcriptional regulator with XRE-family HTH domain [Myxococcota bacterium]|jgi:transcriptional regulator with XRE-family HTH domain